MDQELPEQPPPTVFKKPMLVGKIGKLPKKLSPVSKPTPKEDSVEVPPTLESDDSDEVLPPAAPTEVNKGVPYEEPPWSDFPNSESTSNYNLEVLKNGSIIETINLMKKKFWVFGRMANCDICMQHPTISRYHAVLQYKNGGGFYIYDLESTHGSFLNKNRLRPRSFTKIHVGHMLKLGCSTRTYILNGPPEDSEEESPLSVTELKQQRQLRLAQEESEKKKKEEESSGIDWGLGEDADEETDLSENPYAQTNNEDLYLDNPKKALRGFYEREGLELEYDCTEQGIGQFLCKVELPIDDDLGRAIFAEVLHKGKKKEAVVQCALEACRILDRHGLLRQATHESKKRKPKNWEENDYYDSDDDTFLDRTGTVERKREMRMNSKLPQKAETYESLLEKEKTINSRIGKLEEEIVESQKKLSEDSSSSSDTVDSLDSFMMELKHSKPNKQTVNKLKSELIKLKHEHQNIIKLVNLAKPASLPPLVAEYSTKQETAEKKTLPLFGKRKKSKVELPPSQPPPPAPSDEEEDEDGKVVEEAPVEKKKRNNQRRIQQKQKKAQIQKQKGYDEDAHKEDYNMWVPPTGQSGDGRTSLNEKYGY